MTDARLPLFTYGTLRSDGGQGHLLASSPRRAAVASGRLWHLPAGYPALQPGHDTPIPGEIVGPLDVALLELLDTYEGVAEGLYRRTTMPVQVGRRKVIAWAYVMDHPERRGGRPIADGVWRPFLRR